MIQVRSGIADALKQGLTVTIIIIGAGVGCAPELIPPICDWLGDSKNCYRSFADEIRTRCGVPYDPTTPAESIDDTEPQGSFLTRTPLSNCILDDGGQVVFDPPLDISHFPLSSINFTRLDARSEVCGSGSFSGSQNFSITIEPCSQDENDDWGVCLDNLTGTDNVIGTGEGKDPTRVVGGTFSLAKADVSTYEISCGGVARYFQKGENGECGNDERLMPRAEIESSTGDTIPTWVHDTSSYEGFVRFRIHYPPYYGTPLTNPLNVIQYFNCRIPAQDPCIDGIKNFYETDTDCGGPAPGGLPPGNPEAEPAVRSCLRCEVGQICACNDDCNQTSTPQVCVLDSVSGFNRCTDPMTVPGDPGIVCPP